MSKLLLPILLTLLLSACFREPVYPTLLTEADSAFVRGDYAEAGSLLALYDSLTAQTGKQEATATAVGNYRLLLDLEKKFVQGNLGENDFSAADSLCRVYDRKGTREKHARTLLFLGDIFRNSGDYPSALNCYLQAERIGNDLNNDILQLWATRNTGDVYFEQRMLDDCKSYYRRSFQLAKARCDTLRMAHSAQRMGLVSTIEGKVDSTVFYYKQAVAFAQNLPQKDDIIPIAQSNLCDIYIQAGEFEEAAKLLTYGNARAYNWAYWHLGQNHVDSAIYHFERLLPTGSIQSKVEYLRILIQLEKEKGHPLQVNRYYDQLIEAEDSLRILSQAAETFRARAQYNYNLISRERDELALQSRNRTVTLVIAMTVLLVFSIAAIVIMRKLKKQKEQEFTRARILRAEMDVMLKKSETARANYDEKENQLREKLLQAEQKLCEAKQERKKLKEEEFRESDLYRKLTCKDQGTPYKLDDNEWAELAGMIDSTYEHFTSRLLSIAPLSTTEIHICYLIKLNIPVSDIALLLSKTPSAISQARRRMCLKPMGKPGTADEMDYFLRSI